MAAPRLAPSLGRASLSAALQSVAVASGGPEGEDETAISELDGHAVVLPVLRLSETSWESYGGFGGSIQPSDLE